MQRCFNWLPLSTLVEINPQNEANIFVLQKGILDLIGQK